MTEQREASPAETGPDEDRLTKFKMHVQSDADVTHEQRDKANEDMRFVNVTGGMWEDFLTDDFTEDRVKMEFDVVSNFLQRFLGNWDLNRVGVEYKADDDKTSDDDAELLNGIYRADFLNFSGQVATNLAVEEAATCGYGAIKLGTFFEDDENPENDNQRISWRPIHNAYNTVFWDQAAQRIDKRDARWCTVLKPFTKDSFKEVWPDNDPVSAFTPDTHRFQNAHLETPDFVYVATRYEIVRKKEIVFVYNNFASREVEVYGEDDHELIRDELRASVTDGVREFVRKRTIIRNRVEKTVFSGADILKDTAHIAGKWIPVIPFYGYRSYVDGVEWYRGLVRKLKDAARLFNMQVSQLAENAASSGQEVPIFLRDQMLNVDVRDFWADKNNLPYLVVDPATDNEGNVIATGPIGTLKPAQLDGSQTALLSIVPSFIQDATGGMPQETLNPDMSGKAIKALIEREDLTTWKVTANVADAIKWMGEVYQAMACEIYNDQRIIRTIGKDGAAGEARLLQTVLDAETGRMIQINTLRGKRFRSYADVGPQYATLREQTVEDLKGMLEALANVEGGQAYTPAIIAVLLDNITGVGLDPIKELNRRIMLEQGLVKAETDDERALLQQIQQQRGQPDPNQALLEAAAAQQQAEARSLDSSSIQKVADARKKGAETVKILSDIDIDKDKINLQAQKQIADQQAQIRETIEMLPIAQ